MFIPSTQGAVASTVPAADSSNSKSSSASSSTALGHLSHEPFSQEQVRHLLLGTTIGVQRHIRQLHQLGYAEVNDWSRLLPTGRANEVMAILTKRVNVE